MVHLQLPSLTQLRISNPLAGVPTDVLLANVEDFAQRTGLTNEVDLLKRGALVAQNPGNYENVTELSEEERDALRLEVTKKWSHPFKLYMTVAVCSIGAAVQGWDQTGTNGANLSFPNAFGLDTPEGEAGYERDFWIIGLVNSAPYIGSAFLGCWASDPCNWYLGRRGTIFLSAIILIATPIAGALVNRWEDLLATRIIMGIGMGLKGATAPIFCAENSPATIRGALVMSWRKSLPVIIRDLLPYRDDFTDFYRILDSLRNFPWDGIQFGCLGCRRHWLAPSTWVCFHSCSSSSSSCVSLSREP